MAKARFVRNEIGYGLPTISEETIEQMRAIVKEDKKNIEANLKEILKRIEPLILEQIGAVTPVEKFVDWFFNKKKITEWGDNLPKITDEELITSCIEYAKEIRELIKQKQLSLSTERKRIAKNTIIGFVLKNNSQLNRKQLAVVLDSLKTNSFVSSATTLPHFKKLFSSEQLVKKVEWIGTVNELNYFIKLLSQGEGATLAKITKVKPLWNIVESYFTGINKAGKNFTAQMIKTNTTPPSSKRRMQLIKSVNHLTD